MARVKGQIALASWRHNGGAQFSADVERSRTMFFLNGTARSILDRLEVDDLAEVIGRECTFEPFIEKEMGFRDYRLVGIADRCRSSLEPVAE